MAVEEVHAAGWRQSCESEDGDEEEPEEQKQEKQKNCTGLQHTEHLWFGLKMVREAS